ncbi:hypothetical protein MKOR_14310 [Mycolicibacillus koreensis]|nr:hypothetical protein MKOR_14310 [Mycolicibacillus koreensis]
MCTTSAAGGGADTGGATATRPRGGANRLTDGAGGAGGAGGVGGGSPIMAMRGAGLLMDANLSALYDSAVCTMETRRSGNGG